MKQRRIVTALAIIAVTGAISVPNSLAATWRLDVSDRHVVDRGGLAWDPLVYTQLATGVPRDTQLEYDYIWPYQGASSSERSRHGKDKSSSAGKDQETSTQPHGNAFQNDQSSASPTPPFHERFDGGLPATPSADPSVEALSRE